MRTYSFVLLTFLIFSCSDSGTGNNESNNIIDTERQSAPDFTLQTLENNSLSLSDFQGKVVYIFFLGYNCPFCISNAPKTKRIDESYNDDEVVVIGLDVWNGTVSQLNSFRASTGVQYPLCKNASSVGSDYGVIRDYSVVVDKQGRIAYKESEVKENAIKNVIDTLLQE